MPPAGEMAAQDVAVASALERLERSDGRVSVTQIMLAGFDAWCDSSPGAPASVREGVLAALRRALAERSRDQENLDSVPLQLQKLALSLDRQALEACASLPDMSPSALRF